MDTSGYLTVLARQKLSGQLNYNDRNHIEKRFQMVSMRIDRFHFFWGGGTVQPVHAAGSDVSDTITTTIDQIKH